MRRNLLAYLGIFGPGLVVMLADTDAGSVITAAQSERYGDINFFFCSLY